MESNQTISPMASDLSSSKVSVVILNQIMNLSICLVADPSVDPQSRDALAGVAATVSFILDRINNSSLYGK